ncbi:CD3324 family protein [Paenibacillus sp. LX16]|uniref:CD3324 family protein n=1 Tax=Paenibacillus sp. LX16 TaxID=1740264 RepID=UPI002E2C2DA3|nr:CD3324 family protein [Paenibacillus sp. LX16]
MNYLKATDLLPDDLLKEVQRYIQGELIYIPSRPSERRGWGESSGAALYYLIRNEEIRARFSERVPIDELSEQYGLSVDRIKKIVYSKK